MKMQEQNHFLLHLAAGGFSGFCEAMSCHPLDTIKVRMQLNKASTPAIPMLKPRIKTGPLRVATEIVKNEGFFALYKGIGAVLMGIIPKIAVRFVAFEEYRKLIQKGANHSKETARKRINFIAGLGAGVTEAVLIVNPADVLKIRLQAQRNLSGTKLERKYKNAIHALITIVREEGIGALYRGVTLCAARQATNQAVNFTIYHELKRLATNYYTSTEQIPTPVMMSMGFISGAIGPICNAPIDIIKTKVQRERISSVNVQSSWMQIKRCFIETYRSGGIKSFYTGLTPRILRVAPGQAVIFFAYEKMFKFLQEMFN